MIQKDGTLDPAKPQNKEPVLNDSMNVQDVAKPSTTSVSTVVAPSTIIKASELGGYVFKKRFRVGL